MGITSVSERWSWWLKLINVCKGSEQCLVYNKHSVTMVKRVTATVIVI